MTQIHGPGAAAGPAEPASGGKPRFTIHNRDQLEADIEAAIVGLINSIVEAQGRHRCDCGEGRISLKVQLIGARGSQSLGLFALNNKMARTVASEVTDEGRKINGELTEETRTELQGAINSTLATAIERMVKIAKFLGISTPMFKTKDPHYLFVRVVPCGTRETEHCTAGSATKSIEASGDVAEPIGPATGYMQIWFRINLTATWEYERWVRGGSARANSFAPNARLHPPRQMVVAPIPARCGPGMEGCGNAPDTPTEHPTPIAPRISSERSGEAGSAEGTILAAAFSDAWGTVMFERQVNPPHWSTLGQMAQINL